MELKNFKPFQKALKAGFQCNAIPFQSVIDLYSIIPERGGHVNKQAADCEDLILFYINKWLIQYHQLEVIPMVVTTLPGAVYMFNIHDHVTGKQIPQIGNIVTDWSEAMANGTIQAIDVIKEKSQTWVKA